MRLPVVMANEAVNEGQCLDFFAQPPLWSAESIAWRPYLEHPFNHIETNTRREVTPGDERQSYSKVFAQIGAECPYMNSSSVAGMPLVGGAVRLLTYIRPLTVASTDAGL